MPKLIITANSRGGKRVLDFHGIEMHSDPDHHGHWRMSIDGGETFFSKYYPSLTDIFREVKSMYFRGLYNKYRVKRRFRDRTKEINYFQVNDKVPEEPAQADYHPQFVYEISQKEVWDKLASMPVNREFSMYGLWFKWIRKTPRGCETELLEMVTGEGGDYVQYKLDAKGKVVDVLFRQVHEIRSPHGHPLESWDVPQTAIELPDAIAAEDDSLIEISDRSDPQRHMETIQEHVGIAREEQLFNEIHTLSTVGYDSGDDFVFQNRWYRLIERFPNGSCSAVRIMSEGGNVIVRNNTPLPALFRSTSEELTGFEMDNPDHQAEIGELDVRIRQRVDVVIGEPDAIVRGRSYHTIIEHDVSGLRMGANFQWNGRTYQISEKLEDGTVARPVRQMEQEFLFVNNSVGD